MFHADEDILKLCERLGVDLEGKIYEHFFCLFDLFAVAGGVCDGY